MHINNLRSCDMVCIDYIQKHVSKKSVRLIPVATVACYYNLTDLNHGDIVGAWKMVCEISDVAMKFGFLQTTMSQVFREYYKG